MIQGLSFQSVDNAKYTFNEKQASIMATVYRIHSSPTHPISLPCMQKTFDVMDVSGTRVRLPVTSNCGAAVCPWLTLNMEFRPTIKIPTLELRITRQHHPARLFPITASRRNNNILRGSTSTTPQSCRPQWKRYA